MSGDRENRAAPTASQARPAKAAAAGTESGTAASPEGSESARSVSGGRPPGTRRPGGRTARVRAAVLGATLDELTDHGFDGLTVDGIAARAGVHRATLHRRWGDVGGLLADALDDSAGDDWTPPDTGSLVGDLAALNEEVRSALAEPRSVTTAVIAASFRSEPGAAALRRFLADRYERCRPVVERAVERGDAAEDVDARSVLVAATAPVYQHALLLGDAMDASTARRYAELAAAAAAPGPAGDHRSGPDRGRFQPRTGPNS